MMVFLHLSNPSAVMTVFTRSSLAALVIWRGSRRSAAKYSCAHQGASRHQVSQTAVQAGSDPAQYARCCVEATREATSHNRAYWMQR